MGWNRKVGRRNKDFKKCVCVGGGGGGGNWVKGGCLKKEGAGPPYELWTYFQRNIVRQLFLLMDSFGMKTGAQDINIDWMVNYWSSGQSLETTKKVKE